MSGYNKPATAVGWTAAGAVLPAIAAKAKILFPFTEGAGNPKELVSGETLTLEDGDEWATANGLLGITLVDYVDGATPGTDLAGRALESYAPTFHAPCVQWALLSVPANAPESYVTLFGWNLSANAVSLALPVYVNNFFATFIKTGLQADQLQVIADPGFVFTPGSLISVIAVHASTGTPSKLYINEIQVPDQQNPKGTVNPGDASTVNEAPFNLGYADYQNHDGDGVEVPGTDRFVIHGAGIFEGLTDPEIEAFKTDPFGTMRLASVAAASAGRSRNPRRIAVGLL